MPAWIYCIENKINNKCYVGQTINYNARISKHRSELRRGVHSNTHLLRAYQKYGEKSFIFYKLEKVEDYSMIGERERFWIEKKGYYNIDNGRNGFTPPALRNMSEAHKGIIGPRRKIENLEDIFRILGVTDFCEGSIRPLGELTPYSRTMIREISHRITYKEIIEKYDQLTLTEKLKWLKDGLSKFGYNWLINPGSACPLKNRYITFIIENTKLTHEKVGEIFNMSKGGIRKAYTEIRKGQREINTNYTDREIYEILSVLLDGNTVLNSIDLEKV